ncbi:formyltransferase family protein [Candidatus Merdisoma sp. JLR.KK006]|uniref:formyltransferase family protein n=1 Tax=Candidatus Merdisoma sp. JLR.KK006 TaxID=3112626 RepID=UPI002FF0F617
MLYCPNQKEEDLLYACKQHLTGEALKDAFVFTYDRMRRYGGAWHLDTIVNFHNALLPKFPGRNAPSWAIFENEQETGITWHYVTKQVDAGDIIIQKKCRITADVRAYELTEKLMQLAFEAFKEKFAEIIEDRAAARKQLLTGKRKIYKSSDIPGMCRFGMEDSPEYIYRLLRAEEKPGRLYLPLDGEFSLRLSWAEVCGNFEGGG